ncbi:MAG: precorrin-6A reductase [Ruminococcaceae bacterium]|nr:precorrin-6A reductase [Oscillospiraceae bacterium]
MKHIVVFGGTTEGRELSHLLAARGAAVTVCVATEYGAEEQGNCTGVTVLTGRKTRDEMAALLSGAAGCVDATHPYAVEASANIRDACEAARVPYLRLLRAAGDGAEANRIVVADAREAAAYLAGTTGNILLTTGSKELGAFAALDVGRLYPRVLPSREGIAACEAAGIAHRNIIAMQGPFSRELNEALIRQLQIRYVVTKDGGTAGGYPEKARAAAACGAELIVLRRPKEDGCTFEEAAAQCGEWMK